MRGWARLHVLATAIVGVQLLAWAVTGFAFTLFDFRAVRGSDDRGTTPTLSLATVRLAPADVVARAARPAAIESMRLRSLAGRPVYHLAFASGDEVLIDAEDGRTTAIDAEVAGRIATAAFRSRVSVRRVDRQEEDGRARFVVHLDDARQTQVHVDAASGEIAAWRNVVWRRFDLLWSIHVLGYIDRKSPANWQLRLVGAIAAIATVSGAALLLRRLARRLRAKSRPPMTYA